MNEPHPRPWRVNADGEIDDAVGDQVAFIEQGLMMFTTPTIRDLIVAAVNADSPWISVKDRLPEMRKWVLGLTHFGSMTVAACNSDTGEFWSDQQGYPIHLTHWMPLPDPPPP